MTEKEISTGAVGLIAVIIGVIGHSYIRWINPVSGGIEDASQFSMLVGGGSAILLLVGGIISIIGIAKDSGRNAARWGIVLAVLFLILMFVPASFLLGK